MMQETRGISVGGILTMLALLFLGLMTISSGVGCAGMTPPMGGPRDSLPPNVVNVNPADSTLNFTGKKIEIQFDEFVQVDEIQKNLLVSPVPKVNPTVEARLRTVVVTIRDTLEENTTYAIDFGNAIRDYNESNILHNYRYLFSTGSSLDSLQLGGRVIIAQTGRPDSTLVVMLHTSLDDSAVIKDKPRYVARVDSAGYFRFRNLAPGKYDIYALKDEGGTRRYMSRDQLFAFYDSSVTSQSEKNDIMLYAYVGEDTAQAQPVSSLPPPTRRRTNERGGESILRMQANVDGTGKDLLTPLEFTFTEAIRSFDSTKLFFGDTALTPLDNYRLVRDTADNKLALTYPWEENTAYTVIVDTGFVEDTLGRHLVQPDTISFVTKKKSQYGLVRLRFLNLPLNRNPVLQLVQGDEVKYSHVFTNNEFYAPLFTPGDYDMRLVFDENRNGKWDPGNFFGEKRQPEKVQLIPRKLNVKANWDSEIDIQL